MIWQQGPTKGRAGPPLLQLQGGDRDKFQENCHFQWHPLLLCAEEQHPPFLLLAEEQLPPLLLLAEEQHPSLCGWVEWLQQQRHSPVPGLMQHSARSFEGQLQREEPDQDREFEVLGVEESVGSKVEETSLRKVEDGK